jgi:hypothetical protein
MRFLVLVALLLAGLLLTACDYIISYTVTNETDGRLRTGWFYDQCSYVKERSLRTGPLDRTIQPGTDLKVGGAAPAEPKCVVIKSDDETIILLEPYVYGDRYVVSRSQELAPQMTVTIAAQTLDESSNDSPDFSYLPDWLMISIVALVAGCGVFALFVTGRFFFKFYVRRAT